MVFRSYEQQPFPSGDETFVRAKITPLNRKAIEDQIASYREFLKSDSVRNNIFLKEEYEMQIRDLEAQLR